eukprot:SAG22_NODE_13799_length_394_cov_0.959322_2_plen_59_part_01
MTQSLTNHGEHYDAQVYLPAGTYQYKYRVEDPEVDGDEWVGHPSLPLSLCLSTAVSVSL